MPIHHYFSKAYCQASIHYCDEKRRQSTWSAYWKKMQDDGGQSSPMASVCSVQFKTRKERKKEHAVLVADRVEQIIAQSKKNATEQ
jgi:hypothetical protein